MVNVTMTCVCGKKAKKMGAENLRCKTCEPNEPQMTFFQILDAWGEVMADECEWYHEENGITEGGHNRPDRPDTCFCWCSWALGLMNDDELKKYGLWFAKDWRDWIKKTMFDFYECCDEKDIYSILTECTISMRSNLRLEQMDAQMLPPEMVEA